MTIEAILLWIFLIGVFAGLFFGALTLYGAALYDIREVRRANISRTAGKRKSKKYNPLISIVIPVHNERLVIVRCLESILKSTYKRYEIIISDDKSTDDTRQIVRKFIKKHPKKSIRLVAKRKNGGRGAAIDAGLKHVKGELVMALDADCVLDERAIENMVKQFADGQTAAVAANIRIMDNGNTLSLLQQFDYLVSFRSKKFNTIANSEYIIGGAGATYRYEVVKSLGGFDHSMKTEDIEMSLRIAKLVGNKSLRMKYASDVVIHTEPVPTYKGLFKQRYRWKFGSLQALYKHRSLLFSTKQEHSKFLTLLRLPFVVWCELLLLLEPLYFGYFIYLALSFQNPTLFISACATVTVLLLLTIWSDEHLKLKTKLKLSGYAPMMYPVFYIMTAIQVGAAVQSAINIKSLIGKKVVSGSYVSPDRIGQDFVAENS